MMRTIPLRLMILQFRQIFFTEARTFILFTTNTKCEGWARYCSTQEATTWRSEISLFHQPLVLVGHEVSLYLGHEIHHYHDNNQ